MNESCNFFIPKKRRFCRMTVKVGKKYCGEHLQTSGDGDINEDEERVPCPLDSTHTCYRRRLEKHLKICNSRETEKCEPYIVKNFNLDKECNSSVQTPLSAIESSVVAAVMEKINRTFESIPTISQEVLVHDMLTSELQNTDYSSKTKKHLLQIASLLKHLENSDLLQNDTCFIDFGAGKGKLTYWLAQAMRETKSFSILLVDRSSLRHKMESKLNDGKEIFNVKRIRTDIANLKLDSVPEFHEKSRKVAIAKHLCGAATDLTLRCLVNANGNDSKQLVFGLFIAFCCHHRCDYKTYVGKDFLEKSGFHMDEFSVLCGISSWATCGFSKSLRQEDDVEEKQLIGRKAKAILNWGRVEYLKKFKFDCKLVNYVPSEISLENSCIIALRNNRGIKRLELEKNEKRKENE